MLLPVQSLLVMSDSTALLHFSGVLLALRNPAKYYKVSIEKYHAVSLLQFSGLTLSIEGWQNCRGKICRSHEGSQVSQLIDAHPGALLTSFEIGRTSSIRKQACQQKYTKVGRVFTNIEMPVLAAALHSLHT